MSHPGCPLPDPALHPEARQPEAGPTAPTRPIQAGDRVLALDPENGDRYLLEMDGKGHRKERGLGVMDPGVCVGKPWGTALTLGAKRVILLRPTLPDLVATLRRKAQIILPKDASRIAFELGLGPGAKVLESGVGSGAATTVLAHAVGPTGRVVVQELRDEFADWARDNLARCGLADRVEMHVGDLTQAPAPGVAAFAAKRGGFDAVLLDQPEPWLALPHVAPLLAPGARVACYTPQVSQMEAAARRLAELGFLEVRTLELIERTWEVKERGSRPSFEGLGHTGFLVFALWPGAEARAAHPASA